MPFAPPNQEPTDPKRNVVGIVYDRMTDAVKTQVVRDFLILSCSFDVSYADVKGLMNTQILEELNVLPAVPGSPIDLYVVYKVGPDWLATPPGVLRVERDLCPKDVSQKLSGEPNIGYYLKPQGRTGVNMTLRYLSRAYPKGKGFVQPWLLN